MRLGSFVDEFAANIRQLRGRTVSRLWENECGLYVQVDFRGEELTAAFDLWAPFCSMSVDPPHEGEARGIFPDVFAQLAKKLNFTARQVNVVFVSRKIDVNYSTFKLNCFFLAVCIRYMRRQNR